MTKTYLEIKNTLSTINQEIIFILNFLYEENIDSTNAVKIINYLCDILEIVKELEDKLSDLI